MPVFPLGLPDKCTNQPCTLSPAVGPTVSLAYKVSDRDKWALLQGSLLLACCELICCVPPGAQPVPGAAEGVRDATPVGGGDRPPYPPCLEQKRGQ